MHYRIELMLLWNDGNNMHDITGNQYAPFVVVYL